MPNSFNPLLKNGQSSWPTNFRLSDQPVLSLFPTHSLSLVCPAFSRQLSKLNKAQWQTSLAKKSTGQMPSNKNNNLPFGPLTPAHTPTQRHTHTPYSHLVRLPRWQLTMLRKTKLRLKCKTENVLHNYWTSKRAIVAATGGGRRLHVRLYMCMCVCVCPG